MNRNWMIFVMLLCAALALVNGAAADARPIGAEVTFVVS